MIEIDEYAESFISFMMAYEAQKNAPELHEIFYNRIDPTFAGLLEDYEKGVVDLQQLQELTGAVAREHDALSPQLTLSDKERADLRAAALATMQKHGFTTVEELTAYYDSKRGY